MTPEEETSFSIHYSQSVGPKPPQKKAMSVQFSKMLQERYTSLTPPREKALNERDLMIASGEGIAWRVRALLSRGVDPNCLSHAPGHHFGGKRLMTPTCWAAYRGNTEVLKVLLDAGADPNIADGYGNSPLHWAAKQGLERIAQLLIKSGADVNSTDKCGQTPLYWAARVGHRDVVKVLLSAGADPDKRNVRGESALDGPTMIGDMDVVLLLLDAGARPREGLNCRAI